MATRVIDNARLVSVLKKYRPAITIINGVGGTTSFKTNCPWHSDTNPSFTYTPSRDHGFCHSCQATGTIVQVIASLENCSETQARKILDDAECYKSISKEDAPKTQSTVDVSHAQIMEWQAALTTNIDLQTRMKKWGWTPEIIQKYLLGCSEGRMVIPMFERETLVNVKFYSPGSKVNKYQNMANAHQSCWPIENLDADTVFIVEGEKDCLTMLSAGFNTVTFTGGAASIPRTYLKYFHHKTVIIIYDVDEAGRKGAVEVAKALGRISEKTIIVDIPYEELPAKGDITDLYERFPEDFANRIEGYVRNSDVFVAPSSQSRIAIPAEEISTYLEDIVRKKLFYRRVKIKTRVVSHAMNKTFIIPSEVQMQCNRDYKESICSSCGLYYEKEGMAVSIKPDQPEIMSMISNNTKIQREAIRSMCDIAEKCPRFKIEFKKHQSLYPIVMIPAIEAEKKRHDYSLVEAWALDIPAEENEDYDVAAVVLANPESQAMELICYEMKKDNASLDDFELSPEFVESLKIFQIGEADAGTHTKAD